MKKILVTGGAGYKGIKLTEALLELGHTVTILDNFMYGYDSSLYLFRYPQVHFIQKDIRNIEAQDVAGYDIVYHLAGISGYPACEANPNSADMINVFATERLIKALGKEQLLIYPSTTSFYGKSGNTCDENTPIEPVSLYGVTKYRAEVLCMQRPNTIAFRFATIFGVAPKMRWDLLPNDFTRRAVQERALVVFDPESKRTFLHIDDAIKSYLLPLEKAHQMTGQVYNVGSNNMNFSKREIAEKIAEYTQYDIIASSIPDFDVRNFIINFDKITALGFRPEKTLDDGIRDLVKLYRFYQPTRPFQVI